ncbi:MAG: aldo/keto reductase [Bacteroidota bacterium]
MIKVLKERIANQPVGLGIAALGRPGYMTLTHDKDLPDKSRPAMEKHAHYLFDLAWQNGVRYFDTARSYGDGEKFLASWLTDREIPNEQVVIGSKWGYVYTANWQVKAEKHEIKYHTLENLNRQWEESKAILGDYLNIYHIHSATLESGVLENDAILDRLHEIKQTGVIIGLSLTGPVQAEILKKALKIKYDGELLFGSVQATWNLLETSVQEQLRIAKSEGLFIILKELMANGRIPALSPDYLNFRQIETIRLLGEELKLTADQVAINAALQLGIADIVLSGAATEAHLLSNLKVSARDIDLNKLDQISQKPEDFWKDRSELEWI